MSLEARIKRVASSIIGDTGEILSIHDHGGNEWSVVVSTEYAALRLAYKYRGSPRGAVRIDRAEFSDRPDSWYFSHRPSLASKRAP